jgi:hypothetical protein
VSFKKHRGFYAKPRHNQPVDRYPTGLNLSGLQIVRQTAEIASRRAAAASSGANGGERRQERRRTPISSPRARIGMGFGPRHGARRGELNQGVYQDGHATTATRIVLGRPAARLRLRRVPTDGTLHGNVHKQPMRLPHLHGNHRSYSALKERWRLRESTAAAA